MDVRAAIFVSGLLGCIVIEDLPAQTHPQKMTYLCSDINGVVDLLNGRGWIM